MKYLIVGLGNIGAEYANTRHNIGFLVADALALDLKTQFSTDRYAAMASGKFKGRQLVIIKPSTYMNLSGKAVAYWMQKESIPLENVLIVVDDVALEPGIIRIKTKGGAGGHNGLLHITEILGTDAFARLRFGIGNNFARGFQVDYVLGKWSKEEEKMLPPRIDIAVEAVKSFSTIGAERTMNYYNTNR